MKKLFLFLQFILIFNLLFAGEKQEAKIAFKNHDVKKAVKIMEQYSKEHPGDAEGYFYLGKYLHYAQYDVGRRVYNEKNSNRIIKSLDKAVSLTDTIGNAYYYLGVEYGMRGHYAFIENDTIKSKKEFKTGREKGGYPDWLLEYARNVLKSCKKNAILFTGGDAEANSLWYLQFVKNYRRDVSVIPLGLMSYSPFAKFIKRGIDNFFVPAHINMSDKEIEGMRPHIYKGDTVTLSVPTRIKKEYNLEKNYAMKWQLKPDYVFRGKKIIVPGTDILLHILKENKWERPVYFTAGSQPNLRANLDNYLRTEGLCFHLLPVRKQKRAFLEPDITAKILLNKEDLKYYPSVKEHYMPRCSMVLANYLDISLKLFDYYDSMHKNGKAKGILRFIRSNIDIGVINYGERVRTELDSLYKKYEVQ